MKILLVLYSLFEGKEAETLERVEAMLSALPKACDLTCLSLDGEAVFAVLKAWAGGREGLRLTHLPAGAGETITEMLEDILSLTAPQAPFDLTVFAGSLPSAELGKAYAAHHKMTVASEAKQLETINDTLYAVCPVYSTHREALIPAKHCVILPGRSGPRKAVLWGDPEKAEVQEYVPAKIPPAALPAEERPASCGRLLSAERRPFAGDLGQAKVVFLGGKGLGSRANFERMAALAEKLGAGVGCTRPAALSGWCGTESLVGLSGWHLSAALCVAFGVSGAGPLLQGLSNVKTLIAVNTDPKAPIFQYADRGIVQDCGAVLAAWEALLSEGG